ncbi:hypothetical protein [Xanthomonas sp. SI]|uniref:hypothetical protein n=1 Tax=Xanthomonas sp. SI TaxID=2724123 RepID=UPI00163AE194|nr:hypothetical protein [Xanthomonas sp. SI]QNH11191.1 hypothetical protein HEP75_00609 [Xanthomonas sp. SI]
MLKITGVQLGKDSFQRDFVSLPEEVKAAFRERIPTLLTHPAASRLRLHDLSGFKPKIYKIDVTSSGKMYQATFHLDGSIAVFLRVAIHKEIDRRPI